MKIHPILIFLVAMFMACFSANATDVFYSDIVVKSHSGQYVFKATSPQNKKNSKRRAFQDSFVYTLTDTNLKKTLWTRKQKMGKPDKDGTSFPDEASPARLFVSDSGYSVIYTGWDDLIVIDVHGKQTGKINILKDGFTKKENKDYVHDTTAGPMWGHRSHWYFMEVGSQEYFVVRPWWGRQVIMNVSTGKIERSTKNLKEAMYLAEKSFVIKTLQNVVDGKEERCDCCGGPHLANLAAYLAGKLNVREVISALRKLEADVSMGSYSMGGFDEIPQGRINPFNYGSYNTRQNAQLAMRRVGEKPASLPCTQFKMSHKVYEKEKPYVRKAVKGSRDTNVKKLKKGMSPEQVIDLLDSPDYVVMRDWQYDVDAKEPYTLTIIWTDDRKVKKMTKTTPALWQQGTVRDDL